MRKTSFIIAASIGLFLSGRNASADYAGAADSPEQAFEQATRSAELAGYSLSKVHRWLHAGLPVKVPAGGEVRLLVEPRDKQN